MARIAPSILTADFANLARDVQGIETQADLLHINVMDGHFVPNITLGPPVIASLRKETDLYFDCHLMMQNPGDYLDAFKNAGANSCSVHFEVGNTASLLAEMKSLGMDRGLAVNPATPFEAYEAFLDQIDMLLIMTVVPGFGGQKFMADVMEKLNRSSQALKNRGLQVHVEVDGGIDVDTAPVAALNGADTFVAGSAIFAKANPLEAAAQIREAIEAAK